MNLIMKACKYQSKRMITLCARMPDQEGEPVSIKYVKGVCHRAKTCPMYEVK